MRRVSEIGFEQSLEFQQGPLEEDHVVHAIEIGLRGLQAVTHSMLGKPRIVSLAREALFLGSSDDAAILDYRCGAVVIESGDAQNAHTDLFASGELTRCRR